MTAPPADFICPLTRKLMVDPVTTARGINFERGAILKVLAFSAICPISGSPLRAGSLRSNCKLQWMIRFWESKSDEGQSDGEEVSTETAVFPRGFVCPLTQEVMLEPVTIKEGASFEKTALLQFMERYGEISPLSGEPLGQPCFYPNKKLAWKIDHYRKGMNSSTKQGTVTLHDKEMISTAKTHSIVLPTKDVKQSSFQRTAITAYPTKMLMQDSGVLQFGDKDMMSILHEVCGMPAAA